MRSRLTTIEPLPGSGTPPPACPVCPPWGTMGVPVSLASLKMAETCSVEPGFNTSCGFTDDVIAVFMGVVGEVIFIVQRISVTNDIAKPAHQIRRGNHYYLRNPVPSYFLSIQTLVPLPASAGH